MSGDIIRTEHLTKHYGDVRAVEDLNLRIHRGEVYGLLGPNGAGKTTTTLMLLGLTEPTVGKAYIDGHEVAHETREVKHLVGYLPDNVGFYPDMTGLENLIFTGKMNGLTRKESEEKARELLERVGITYAADRKTKGYSRGMRQRLGIADTLMKDPEIIIMDEPTLGIDPAGIHELLELIRALSTKDGRTILLSSHQLYQVQQICDRVGIFVNGKLIANGPIEGLGKQLESQGLYIMDFQIQEEPTALIRLLEQKEGVSSVTKNRDGSIHVESARDIRREMIGFLMMNNYTLIDLHGRGGDLEEIYRKYFEMAGESDDGGEKEKSGAGNGKG